MTRPNRSLGIECRRKAGAWAWIVFRKSRVTEKLSGQTVRGCSWDNSDGIERIVIQRRNSTWEY
jgi:hypothetical protein